MSRIQKTVDEQSRTGYIKSDSAEYSEEQGAIFFMADRRFAIPAVFAILTWTSVTTGCSSDTTPSAATSVETTADLALSIPIPKALIIVVDRVVATLEGPGIQTVVKELDVSPTGPATGTIGAIPPAIGLTLTVEGFDLDGLLLFTGQQRGISISAGDTTVVNLQLTLVQEIPSTTEPDTTETTN